MTDEEIIQKAGSEWQRTRGDMNSYLRIIIRLTREQAREECIKKCYEVAPTIMAADKYAKAIREI